MTGLSSSYQWETSIIDGWQPHRWGTACTAAQSGKEAKQVKDQDGKEQHQIRWLGRRASMLWENDLNCHSDASRRPPSQGVAESYHGWPKKRVRAWPPKPLEEQNDTACIGLTWRRNMPSWTQIAGPRHSDGMRSSTTRTYLHTCTWALSAFGRTFRDIRLDCEKIRYTAAQQLSLTRLVHDRLRSANHWATLSRRASPHRCLEELRTLPRQRSNDQSQYINRTAPLCAGSIENVLVHHCDRPQLEWIFIAGDCRWNASPLGPARGIDSLWGSVDQTRRHSYCSFHVVFIVQE